MESILKPTDIAFVNNYTEAYVVVGVTTYNDSNYYFLIKSTGDITDGINYRNLPLLYAKEVITEEQTLDLEFVEDEELKTILRNQMKNESYT